MRFRALDGSGPRRIPPFFLPIFFFGVAILLGAFCLRHPAATATGQGLPWIDAIFTATSAVCVTGLGVVDTGAVFSRFGHLVILLLIQIGGLGIMTFTGLAFFLWRRRVSLSDRIAIGQTLLHDPSFHLGHFLLQLVLWSVGIELAGALLIHLQAPEAFPAFSALFHAVSAFCNAGFSLHANSLMAWKADWGINLTFMALIILGGLGFSVLVETRTVAWDRLYRRSEYRKRFSWYAAIVLRTTIFLILGGALGLFLAEYVSYGRQAGLNEALLTSLFQSVTSRTAGFNTVDISQLTNVSLLVIIFLMFIGGAPGSCAGGIKVTTFRGLVAFVTAQLKGEHQTRIGRFALDRETVNNTLTLFVFYALILVAAILLLDITEGGVIPHPQARGLFLDLVFEAVSAFGTVGLSTGITPKLTAGGKSIVILLMFIGRLGPLVFIAALHGLRREKRYALADERLLIG